MDVMRSRLTEMMRKAARAVGGWLRNHRAMILAGQEIAWQLNSGGSGFSLKSADHSSLLWRTYGKYGVVLRDAEPRLELQIERRRRMVTTVDECVTLARAELKVAKAKVTREIRNYPTPIAGCDCQFNHLLFERTRISAALRALESDRFAVNQYKA